MSITFRDRRGTRPERSVAGHDRRFQLSLFSFGGRGMVCLPGPEHADTRKVITMRDEHKTPGKRLMGMRVILVAAALLLASVIPAHAWRGSRVFIGTSVVVPFGPYWGPYWSPYWAPYGYPTVVAVPPPTVYVQPSPQAYVQPPPPPPSWYYCENPAGYYPYVQQCPGGWRQVTPRPQ